MGKKAIIVIPLVSSILVLIISLWIALLQPNLLMSGICVSLASISLYGLLSLRRIVFVISFPVLAIFLIASIFAAPIKGLMQEVMVSLQLLLVIHAAEIGSSSIYFDRILRRMREPVEGTTVSSPAPTPAERMRSVKDVRTLFPKELEDMLNFEETAQYIIIKPRQYLGSENFAKIASIVG